MRERERESALALEVRPSNLAKERESLQRPCYDTDRHGRLEEDNEQSLLADLPSITPVHCRREQPCPRVASGVEAYAVAPPARIKLKGVDGRASTGVEPAA